MYQPPINELQIVLKALSFFRTHWWLFLLEVIAVYSISMHKFYSTRPVYESQATILIDSTRRQLYQSVILPGFKGNDMARKQNMVHLLTGQEIMERFRTQLADFYNSEGRPNHLRVYFPLGKALQGDLLRNNISINWDKNSDIYSIRCTAESANAVHDLCLVYMNTIQSYYPEVGQREALMKRDFLSRQIASFLGQIKDREQGITEFQKKNEDFFNFMSLNIEERGLQKLRTERTALRNRIDTNRAIKQLILTIPRAKRGEHTARHTVIQTLTAKIAEIQYQIQLTQQSEDKEKSEKVAELRSLLAEVSSQLQKFNEEEVDTVLRTPVPTLEVRKKLAELELEYRTDKIRLAKVETEFEEVVRKERLFNQQRLEYERLFTELNHKKKLLTNLYQKEQETELELSAGNAEVFRLQEPTRTSYRVAPQLSRHLYGSLSFSLFIVALTNILLMAFFPRLDSEAEVNRMNLPVIGKVPLLKTSGRNLEELPGFGMEYLKIMNYRIARETKDIKCPVVVISSPHAREGKSTVTNLLCMASESSSRKSLLIDGDLLTSHPNKFFGFTEDASRGLQGALDSNCENLNDFILKTSYQGISFMPRGTRFDPTGLPNFQKSIEKMLSQLRKEYDVIYIDTPPLFASNLAHQWAGLGDIVVLVARIYATHPKDIAEALQTVKVFSKSPVGIALNCVRLSGQSKRASNYYFSRRKPSPSRIAA